MGSIDKRHNGAATCSSLTGLRAGIATISLGYADAHNLHDKLKACADAGFQGIEVFPHDLETSRGLTLDPRSTAKLVRELCDEYQLEVISLQPFRNSEGLIGQERRSQKLEELREYFNLCHILQTDLIGLPSMFIADPTVSTGERKVIERDLATMARLGRLETPPIRFAYEAVAWGPHVSRWQDAWDLVQKIDQPNLGLCVDTFQLLAKVWVDMTRPDGKRDNANEVLRMDLQELKDLVRVEKLFLLQAADASKANTPLAMDLSRGAENQQPLMKWSRKARLFPLEEDRKGYLPIIDVLRTCVLELGYRGWISMEIFNDELAMEDAAIPGTYASRGIAAYSKMKQLLEIT